MMLGEKVGFKYGETVCCAIIVGESDNGADLMVLMPPALHDFAGQFFSVRAERDDSGAPGTWSPL